MSRSGVALVIGVVAVLAAGAYYLGRVAGRRAAPDNPPAPTSEVIGPLAVESSSLDLGEVWEEPAYVHTLSLFNQSTREVKITDVLASCGCVSVSPRSFTVPAGGSTQLTVTLDLTKRGQSEIGRDVRPFAVQVFPRIPGVRTPGEQAGWTIAGEVRSRLTLDTLALDFGERPVFGEPAEPRILTATVHVPAQALKITFADAGVAANLRPLDSAGEATRYAIELTPETKTLTPGHFKTRATVSVVTPSGETLFGARLPVEGVVRPEASLLPASLVLGPRPVGETATGTLVLQGRAGKDLVLQQIETDSPDLTVAPTAVEGAPDARAWRVNQRVLKAGDQSTTVHFVFSRAGRQIAATVVISSFGEVTPGAARPTNQAQERQP